MVIFCIIPARGGSKGIPKKNIQPFLGQALITHSIEYAKNSELVTEVFVSTDDNAIATVSKEAGSKIISRPAEISGDTATTESAIAHALETWKKDGIVPDIIVLLQATSPLRPVGSLDSALQHFVDNGFDSLLSISPTHRFFWHTDGDEAHAEYDYKNRPRRQDMIESDLRYVENGSLYIFTCELFEKEHNRLGGKIGYSVFPEEYGLEIDSPTDLMLLEDIATKLNT